MNVKNVGKRFTSTIFLNEHILRLTSFRKFKCDICAVSQNKELYLQAHADPLFGWCVVNLHVPANIIFCLETFHT